MSVPRDVVDATRDAETVVVLTGAGMSAESGVATFRDADNGLWSRFSPEELATPQAWDADPALVWGWYLWRFGSVRNVQPNAGHIAVAEWEMIDGIDLSVVTQNVDDLHERAGSVIVHHLHGALSEFRCDTCESPYRREVEWVDEPTERVNPIKCPQCVDGRVRPGVVWFGEVLPPGPWTAASSAVEECDLAVVVGTSGMVTPAAYLPDIAKSCGAAVIELNPEDSELSDRVDYSWRVSAAKGLPQIVAALK